MWTSCQILKCGYDVRELQTDPAPEYAEPPRQRPPWSKWRKDQGAPTKMTSTATNTEPLERRGEWGKKTCPGSGQMQSFVSS